MMLTLAAAAAVLSLGAQEKKMQDRPEMPKDAVVTTTFKTTQEAEEALAKLLSDKGFEVKEGERFAAFAPKPEIQPKEGEAKESPGAEGFRPDGPRPDGFRPDGPRPDGFRPGGHRGHGGPGHGHGHGHGPMRPGVFAEFALENGTVTVTLSGMGVELKEIAEALPNQGINYVEHKLPEKPERR